LPDYIIHSNNLCMFDGLPYTRSSILLRHYLVVPVLQYPFIHLAQWFKEQQLIIKTFKTAHVCFMTCSASNNDVMEIFLINANKLMNVVSPISRLHALERCIEVQ
ncbi:hypothetical protein ACJX0J_011203, partial [Zea mays]